MRAFSNIGMQLFLESADFRFSHFKGLPLNIEKHFTKSCRVECPTACLVTSAGIVSIVPMEVGTCYSGISSITNITGTHFRHHRVALTLSYGLPTVQCHVTSHNGTNKMVNRV